MVASKIIEAEIRNHQLTISRLKREIFGVDKTHRSRYIREFHSEFRRFRRRCGASEVVEAAARSDVVYFGDYHPLNESQDWILFLMKELAARGRKVVLALEMLYVQQQEFLDRWMKGRMTEREFLEAIEYRSEWGFNWASYRRLFEAAKDPFVPIFGIDSEQRDRLKYIRRRDRLAAQRIGTIRRFFPGSCILVVVGESHLASNHLPRDVRRVLGSKFRETVIVQNIDDIYWTLLRTGREEAEAVQIDERRYCVFTASPMLKYRAYREIIDVWVDGEEVDRHTPFLHETIESIFSFLARGRGKHMVTLKDGRREALEAVLPEVQCRATYHAFCSYMRSRKVSPHAFAAALEGLKNDGIAYCAEINTFLIVRFDPVRAVRESARFIYHLLRGELWQRPAAPATPEDGFYGAVVAEALVCFAARIANPSPDCSAADPLLAANAAGGTARPRLPRRTMRETNGFVRALRYLMERERAAPGVPRMTAPLRSIVSRNVEHRAPLVRALGARLGDALHRLSHEGGGGAGEIVKLYGAPRGGPGEAVSLYFDLLARTDARPR